MLRRMTYSFIGLAVCLAVICVCGVTVVNWGNAKEPPAHFSAQHPGKPESKELRVDVVSPRVGGIERSSTQPGSVHSFETADLYAKISGYLTELPVDIGDRVKVGQVLAVIDSPELEKDVQRAVADVEKAKAGVVQMEASVAVAKAQHKASEAAVVQAFGEIKRDEAKQSFQGKQFRRMKELYGLKSIDERLVDEKEDQFLASESAVDVAKAAVVTAQAQVAAAQAKIDAASADLKNAEAEVQVAEANLAKSKVFLNYTKIVSPYDGVVTLRSFHRGAFIREATAGGAVPVLRVERSDLMRVVVQVPDLDVPFVNVGDPATIQIATLPGINFKGKVSRCAESEDHETRTMRTEIDLPNPDHRLRDGMYGRVIIKLQAGSKSAFTVPASTLVGKSENSKGQIYVVRDGKARLIPVVVGTDNGVDVEILGGLDINSQVISRYNGAIGEGVPVVISNADVGEKSKHEE
ncbi:MAG: efflux transporter periplasmic adaptor subunit [Planctomycetaceae bacterium]|nr:efflux transporter periplasmic adaptor subunit [Planctomycetaceae bacterium]